MLRHILTAGTLAAVAIGLATGPVFAWGNEGHEIIATLAAKILKEDSPSTLEKVNAILATDNGNEWTPEWEDTDIATEATWADVCREKNNDCRKTTQLWHFVDIDFDHPDVDTACFGHHPPDGEASHSPVEACVIDKIGQFTKELANPQTPPEERLLALKFLLHFVGDIHQPLHATTRHDPETNHDDFGGNCVGILRGNAKKPQRLHSYWDTALVQRALKKDVDQAADALMPLVSEHIDDWSGGSPGDWAKESNTLAHSSAYAGVVDTDPVQTDYMFPGQHGSVDERCGPSKVYKINTQKYDKQAMQTVRVQLAKAGLRLARALQESLP